MTLATTTTRNRYTGAGSVGPYPYTYRILAATDLEVIKTPASGLDATLSYPADYTVSGVGNNGGGSLTLTVALAVGESLTVRRVRPLTQDTRLSDVGEFFASTHEKQFDHATMVDQQQQDQLDRSLRLKASCDPADYNLELTAPEANKALFANSGGTGLEYRTIDSSAIGLPGESRTVATATAYLANNAFYKNVKDYGTASTGSGTVDDRAALALADGADGATKPILLTGIHRVDSNLTIASPITSMSSAGKLRPSSGVVITLTGPISVDAYHILDTSLGGSFVFSGRHVPEFNAQWFGITGDGVTDDAPLVNTMTTMLPLYSRVRFSGGMDVLLNSTWLIQEKKGIKFYCPTDPRQGEWIANTGLSRLKYRGAANGIAVDIRASVFCEVSGFYVDSGEARTAFNLDYGTTSIGGAPTYSQRGGDCLITRNTIYNAKTGTQLNREAWYGVKISEHTAGNQEYHQIIDNRFSGQGAGYHFDGNISVNVGVSNTTVNATSGGGFTTAMDQGRVVIKGAGAAGVVYEGRITVAANGMSATVSPAMSTTIAGTSATISTRAGTAIKAWSANTHRIQLHRNDISGCQYGVWWQGGSFQAIDNQLFTNDVNWLLAANTLPIYMLGDNCEDSFQHIWMTNNPPDGSAGGLNASVYNLTPRMSLSGVGVQYAIVQNDTPRHLMIDGPVLENTIAAGRAPVFGKQFDYYQVLLVRGVTCTAGVTLAQLGLSAGNDELGPSSFLHSIGGENRMFGGGTWFGSNGEHSFAAIRAETNHHGNAIDPQYGTGIVGITSKVQDAKMGGTPPADTLTLWPARSTRRASGNSWIFGVTGSTIKHTALWGTAARTGALHASLPVGPNFGMSEALGLLVTAAEFTGGASVGTSKGIVIEPLQDNTHSPTGIAIDIEGTKDLFRTVGPMSTAARQAGCNAAAVAAAGTYTPDASLYETHRLTCNGNVTIGAPTWQGGTPPNGAEMIIHILNNTAGAITVTLNAAIKGGFTPPVTLNSSSRRWQYDATSGHWWPVGAQSPDFLP